MSGEWEIIDHIGKRKGGEGGCVWVSVVGTGETSIGVGVEGVLVLSIGVEYWSVWGRQLVGGY